MIKLKLLYHIITEINCDNYDIKTQNSDISENCDKKF